MFGGIFDELFAPGRKHLEDERNRLQITRDEEGDGQPGRGPIDLTSGKVVMSGPESGATAPGGAVPDAREQREQVRSFRVQHHWIPGAPAPSAPVRGDGDGSTSDQEQSPAN